MKFNKDELLKQLLEKEELPNITNEDYIMMSNVEKEENKTALEEAMEPYGDQKWWLSNDIKTRAFGQLFEPIMVTSFSDMRVGIEKILERQVHRIEFKNTLGRLQTQVLEAVYEELNEVSSDIVC